MEVGMPDYRISLTEEEKDTLKSLLRTELDDSRVEVHHTITPTFRDQVKRQEELIRGLLSKLESPKPAA